jgi:sterol-4alpha-carboxylate 3-dehydrogenase (decarboxylating)
MTQPPLTTRTPSHCAPPALNNIFFLSISVAKTLLWEDTKQTMTVLLLLAVIYYQLFTCGYTIMTAMAKLFSLTALFLFIHGILPANV